MTTEAVPIDPDLLTIPATAQRLSVQKSTVYRLIRNGDLRAVNIARTGTKPRMRIRTDDLQKFIEKRTADPTSPTVEDAIAASS